MSPVTANSADPGATPESGATAQPSAPGAEPLPDRSPPVPGRRWQEVYDIQSEPAPDESPRCWRAVHVDTGREVLIRTLAGRGDGAHAEAWRILTELEHPGLARAYPAVELGPDRYEIEERPAGRAIAEWAEGRTFDAAALAEIVGPLADALGALHARGLGHFHLRPEAVAIAGEPGAWQVVLGGFDRAGAFGRDGLVPIEVDLFSAPPEAAGLFQHKAGPALAAWDWWSLGRLLQTLLLGRHVFAALWRRDVSRLTPELAARAESALLEREAAAGRAGAVEEIPGLDARSGALLRGLLTTSRDGRWGADLVAAWRRGETPKDYYKLPRSEVLFRWRDRGWTVADAAAELRTAANWPEALTQLADAKVPGTLAHFIADVPVHRPLHARIEELARLADTTALKVIPTDLVREVITAVALLELDGAALHWCGYRMDAAGLRTLFAERAAGGVDRVALLRACATRPVVMLVERLDPDAARALTEFGQTLAAADAAIPGPRWLRDRDPAALPRLCEWSLQAVAPLHAAAKEVRERYACSTDAAVDKLLKLERPGRGDLVALLWLATHPTKCGLLTHGEWAAREDARLRAEGAGPVAALFWARLHRAQVLGPMLFGRWWIVVPFWLGVGAAVALLWPGANWLPMALAPGLLALGLRLAGAMAARGLVRRTLPDLRPWRWFDGAARSAREQAAVAAGRSPETLRRALRDLNAELARLKDLEPPPAALRVPRVAASLWLCTFAGWLLVAGVAAGGAWRVRAQRPSWQAFRQAWNPPPEVRALAAKQRKAKEDDGPVKISWPFKPGDDAQVLHETGAETPTAEQLDYVEERGRALARRYKVETVTTLVILRVPAGDRVGVMVYDLRQQHAAAEKVFFLDYAPLARAWIEVGGHAGIYLPD